MGSCPSTSCPGPYKTLCDDIRKGIPTQWGPREIEGTFQRKTLIKTDMTKSKSVLNPPTLNLLKIPTFIRHAPGLAKGDMNTKCVTRI